MYCEDYIEDIPGWLKDLRNELAEYGWYLSSFGDREYALQIEELDMEREFLEMCLEYCTAEVLEVEARKRAYRHEERLQKFLQVKRENF